MIGTDMVSVLETGTFVC